MAKKVYFDALRSLAFGGISGSYAKVGGVFTVEPCMICITNRTQGDMLFSFDGTTDNLFIVAGSYKLFDLQSNMNPHFDDAFVMAKGTQVWVKEVTAPTSGSVYVELIYG